MQFTTIRTTTDMQALSGEWNALLEKSASHVPFLRFEYLNTWWKNRGGGEWADGELFVVTAREENGELVGIAPLFFTKNRQDQDALMLLGSIEISDYLDVIVPHEKLPEFLSGLMDFLTTTESPAWQVLDWYNLLETSPTLTALAETAEKRGCKVVVEALQHCPCIPLPKDWEEYLAGIDKKQRHEIRRKMRRAQASGEPAELVFVKGGDNLDAEMDNFFRLMASDPEKEKFLSEAMRTQMKDLARAAAQEGYLQLAFMKVGAEKAAAYLNFDYLNRVWVYNSGFDPRFRELSLGWVLLGHLIQWSIEQGRSAFDFMRGDEDYKYRFGAVDRRVMRIKVER